MLHRTFADLDADLEHSLATDQRSNIIQSREVKVK